MSRRRFLSVSLLCFFAAANAAADDLAKTVSDNAPAIEVLVSPVTVRLRGLSAVDENIAWASGREGTVIRTIDAGKTWSTFKVPGAEKLDFRDVEGFSADEAVILSIGPGEDSRVYRTSDGGSSWTLVLRNKEADGFFDCMDFREGEGRLLGDPVRGRFQIYASSDGGRSWRWTKGPKALTKEAAFAASGTCVHRLLEGTVVVTGGSHARVLYAPDRLRGEWHALEVPDRQPLESSGLFSIASREGELVAVGGDFKRELDPGPAIGVRAWANVARFGKIGREGAPYLGHEGNDLRLKRVFVADRWYNVEFGRSTFFEGAPNGYRSAIACEDAPAPDCIATGPSGSDYLGPTRNAAENAQSKRNPHDGVLDGSRSISSDDLAIPSRWTPLSGLGFDSVSIAGRVAWFSGDGGRLGRLVLPE